MISEERYYRAGQDVICDWMDKHQSDDDYREAVQEIGQRIYNDLQTELADENGDPLLIARWRGELSRLD